MAAPLAPSPILADSDPLISQAVERWMLEISQLRQFARQTLDGAQTSLAQMNEQDPAVLTLRSQLRYAATSWERLIDSAGGQISNILRLVMSTNYARTSELQTQFGVLYGRETPANSPAFHMQSGAVPIGPLGTAYEPALMSPFIPMGATATVDASNTRTNSRGGGGSGSKRTGATGTSSKNPSDATLPRVAPPSSSSSSPLLSTVVPPLAAEDDMAILEDEMLSLLQLDGDEQEEEEEENENEGEAVATTTTTTTSTTLEDGTVVEDCMEDADC